MEICINRYSDYGLPFFPLLAYTFCCENSYLQSRSPDFKSNCCWRYVDDIRDI